MSGPSQQQHMQHHYLAVDPSLEDFVRTVLVLDNNSTGKGSDLPMVTNGMPAMVCRVSEGKSRIRLYGQSADDEEFTQIDKACTIAFFFRPFALGTTFRISAQELKNGPIDLSNWHAQKAWALNIGVLNAGSMEERLKILSDFVFLQTESNKDECKIIRHATDAFMYNSGPEVLSELLHELNLSERTFQRIFKKYVGIPANEYRRICQFYFAFSHLRSGRFDNLADVAYSNGYFDQSHYIRSFREFMQTTPREYLQSGLKKKNE